MMRQIGKPAKTNSQSRPLQLDFKNRVDVERVLLQAKKLIGLLKSTILINEIAKLNSVRDQW